MKRVCVFCGSQSGANPLYGEAAVELGRLLVRQGLGLVYGGGHIGLMGVIADAVLAAGGEVDGVIPRALMDRELAHMGCTRLHDTTSMHDRKALMADLSDAFVALPGGYGTLDESFEILTWAQLGLHQKPIAFLNTGGYFDGLLAFVDHAVAEGFIKPKHRVLLARAATPVELLELLFQ